MTAFQSKYRTLVAMEGAGRLIYGRLKPNIDLVSGLEKLFTESGYGFGVLRGGIGSLNQANLCGEGGELNTIQGPGLEIVSVCGFMRKLEDETEVKIWAVIADADGRVHEGEIRRDLNHICVTFDAAIEECRDQPVPTFSEQAPVDQRCGQRDAGGFASKHGIG
jgi:predicted DNA-binding protein with PD1-like motif